MLFGEIVTDFLIRCCGYSLIKSSNQKIIITSRNDSTKRFRELLYEGYSLQRREKVVYVDISNSMPNSAIKGYFYKMPVIPTHDSIGYKIDEIIEVSEGKYTKVLSPKCDNN